jgi:hypothetical protein
VDEALAHQPHERGSLRVDVERVIPAQRRSGYCLRFDGQEPDREPLLVIIPSCQLVPLIDVENRNREDFKSDCQWFRSSRITSRESPRSNSGCLDRKQGACRKRFLRYPCHEASLSTAQPVFRLGHPGGRVSRLTRRSHDIGIAGIIVLGVGVGCATSFGQRHMPIGTMTMRAIVPRTSWS